MADSAATADQPVLPLINQLARVGQRVVDTCIPDSLRPRQLLVLTVLDEHGPTSQQALGEALRLDPSNVVGLLNELEERGLVTRRRDPVDRRRHIVELSSAGADELARTNSRLRLVEDEVLQTLSAEERTTLHGLLVRVVGVTAPGCNALPCGASGEPPTCTP
ncbi:MarR family winged helix-turn-helix transcriptional regulator [Actinoallomurus sp. CA-150999]|uniref:MarR family winged helix-turn-helix transcriptional regulator n=1 Tax=Actinoallomurus sp. CA-150999 TaxID=3239887 RepID=UPI003D947DB8